MKRILIAVLAAGVLGILLLGWSMFGDHSSFQTGLDRYEKLPATSSDITIFRNSNITGEFLADFKVSEHDFVLFATENHWLVQPITNAAVVFQAKAFHEGHPNDTKEISDGLYYSQRAANGGGVTVAYDRKNGRAYIESSSR